MAGRAAEYFEIVEGGRAEGEITYRGTKFVETADLNKSAGGQRSADAKYSKCFWNRTLLRHANIVQTLR